MNGSRRTTIDKGVRNYETPWGQNRQRHCAGDSINSVPTQVVGCTNWREAVNDSVVKDNERQAESFKRLGSSESASYGDGVEDNVGTELGKFSRPFKKRCGNSSGEISARCSGADAT